MSSGPVLIPVDIWMDTELSWVEKLYLTEIYLLSDAEKGCYASNKHLGTFFSQPPGTAKHVIQELEKKKAIKLWYDEKTKRHITLIHPAYRETNFLSQENVVPIDDMKTIKKTARDYFFKLYGFKAREITGRFAREDGNAITPPWTGKEGKLFKSDFEQYGLRELKRLMLLFFSDRISEVADFTRYKEKAGYAYTVFHGMIAKLSFCEKTIQEPCMECGSYKGHYSICSKYVKPEVIKEISEEEIEEGRKELGESFSLQEMIQDHIKQKRNTNQDSYLEVTNAGYQ
jgi:hypothetical protein